MGTDLKLVTGVTAFVMAVAVHHKAQAASFDCTHAASPREQLICHDPALSALDEQLGRTYRERRAALSPHGAELLQRSEQSWLHFIATVCPLSVSAEDHGPQNPKNCLETHYRERLDQLAKAGQKLGPFVFNRIDLYAAQPADADDKSGATPGFYTVHVAYPQIDNALSPQVESWNKQNVKSLPVDGDCRPGDFNNDYELGYANSNTISMQWSFYEYCYPTPHGMGWYKANNVVLSPNLLPLTGDKVFGPGNHWVEPLRKLFWDALLAAGWSPPDNQAQNETPDILNDVGDPEQWLFTAEGLKISFGSYEGGCYACTPQPVTVPWDKLKPLLSPNAVVP